MILSYSILVFWSIIGPKYLSGICAEYVDDMSQAEAKKYSASYKFISKNGFSAKIQVGMIYFEFIKKDKYAY